MRRAEARGLPEGQPSAPPWKGGTKPHHAGRPEQAWGLQPPRHSGSSLERLAHRCPLQTAPPLPLRAAEPSLPLPEMYREQDGSNEWRGSRWAAPAGGPPRRLPLPRLGKQGLNCLPVRATAGQLQEATFLPQTQTLALSFLPF